MIAGLHSSQGGGNAVAAALDREVLRGDDACHFRRAMVLIDGHLERLWSGGCGELVLDVFHQHNATNAFESSTGTSRATAEEHTGGQYYPSDVRPLSGVIVEKPCCGHK